MKLYRRYKTLAELERIAGEFRTAFWHRPDGQKQGVTVWCSNDYLGMGQRPDVLGAMHEAIDLREQALDKLAVYPAPIVSMSPSKPNLLICGAKMRP